MVLLIKGKQRPLPSDREQKCQGKDFHSKGELEATSKRNVFFGET